jgi:hypothetical protein
MHETDHELLIRSYVLLEAVATAHHDTTAHHTPNHMHVCMPCAVSAYLEQRDLAPEASAQAAMHSLLIESRQHMVLLLKVLRTYGAITDACGHLVE